MPSLSPKLKKKSFSLGGGLSLTSGPKTETEDTTLERCNIAVDYIYLNLHVW
jgi:hypothetical protein